MRFLLDENLSPALVDLLKVAGHDAIHVRELGLASASDDAILERAGTDGRTLISADTDFGQLLAGSGAKLPSLILLRRETDRTATAQAQLLLGNLNEVLTDLEAGAIVVMEATSMRVRRLPVTPFDGPT